MNLLFSITAYPPSIGGAQIHTHQLAQVLSSQNNIKVFSIWDRNRSDWLLGTTVFAGNHSADYLIDGISVHRMGLSKFEKLKSIPSIIGYYAVMKPSIDNLATIIQRQLEPYAEGVEIIHNIRVGREPISFASFNSARKAGIPFVFSPLHHPRWGGWRHRYYHRLYREADALIALTSAEKKALVEMGVRDDKIFITGIGPVLANDGVGLKFREKYSLPEMPIVLFLGQKYPYKGIQLLVKAAELVWAKYPETLFVLAGPRTRYSIGLFKQILDPRIIELDSLDIQTKTDALDACSMLCLPSSQESFGGVFTEAWQMGKPVIGCRIPAVETVISEGVDGLLIDCNERDLAEKINTLLANKKLADQMGKAGKKKVFENFTWKKLAEKTMSAYYYALSVK